MDRKQAMIEINRTFNSIFGKPSPFSLDIILGKFAFDVKLPQSVQDSMTHQTTWAQSINPTKFISQKNMEKYEYQHGWVQPRKEVETLNDILKAWNKINYTTTERLYDCVNVHESDPMYRTENAFRCTDCRDCKNIIFCDGCAESENIVACQRSTDSSFCLRVDDSGSCVNSYNVICSGKISNSFFIQDCNSLNECMFCSHVSNKTYYIANMPFQKEEYFEIKKEIVSWILSS